MYSIKEVDILFDEGKHIYYEKDSNKVYTSVTTLIGNYTKKFNTYYWAMYSGLKNKGFNLKPDFDGNKFIMIAGTKYKIEDLYKDPLYKAYATEMAASWEAKTLEACMRGNDTHNTLEDSINYSKKDITGSSNVMISPNIGKKVIKTQHDLEATGIQDKYPRAYERLKGYIDREFSIFAEKRVYLPEYEIAGMIDVPIVYKDSVRFCILDWKTNKDTLHNTSGYYKKKLIQGTWVVTDEWIITDERFEYPLNMLPKSKFHTYALQLSLYAYILECWGYVLINGGLEIMHFPLNNEPRLIKIPYLKNEVIAMLEHHKQTKLFAA